MESELILPCVLIGFLILFAGTLIFNPDPTLQGLDVLTGTIILIGISMVFGSIIILKPQAQPEDPNECEDAI